jgi:hypothetical protein
MDEVQEISDNWSSIHFPSLQTVCTVCSLILILFRLLGVLFQEVPLPVFRMYSTFPPPSLFETFSVQRTLLFVIILELLAGVYKLWSSSVRNKIRDSVVGIATSYRLDDRGVGVRVPVRPRIFSSPRRPDRLWGPPYLVSSGNLWLFSGFKRPGREADQSPPASAQVKKIWIYTSIPHTLSWRSAQLVKHRTTLLTLLSM